MGKYGHHVQICALIAAAVVSAFLFNNVTFLGILIGAPFLWARMRRDASK